MDKRELLALFSVQFNGDWSLIAKAIQTNLQPLNCEIKDAYITIYDEAYPKEFHALRFPPWVIFYEGNLSLLEKRKVSIVGARDSIPYGEKWTKEIVRTLKDRYVFVSGLAKGIDACVHEEAILSNGNTIGIIGQGLGSVYPKSNQALYDVMRKDHLILTEYPHYVGVRKHHFPWRNRLIASLGEVLFVSQARQKSGTMLTVNEAIQLSKDIYCLAYPFEHPEGEGCHQLIEQGANILYSLKQLEHL